MKKGCPEWLGSAIFYQIYPQSFNDSNGDGIGDIPGIIEKLDYIKALGCDAMWINPCFVSPFNDAGYDVTDYYKIAPRYGSNSDVKKLFKVAHKKGIRVCLDLVAGHTSIEHPWFRQSCKAEKNKYSNRYIWTDSPWGWDDPQSSCGLTTIHGYGNRNGAYATNFFWSQAALNYGFAKPDARKPWQLPVDHPDCRATCKELKKIMRYWLDMGAAGFRVDMAKSLVKGDADRKATIALWQSIRQMIEKDYPEAALIAEWFNPPEAVEGGFHIDFIPFFGEYSSNLLFRSEENAHTYQMFFDADRPNSFFAKKGKGDAAKFLKSFMQQCQKIKGRGYIGLYSGNHDIKRISLNRTQREIELVFAFILTMPAVPFIYYGDEIAMRHKRDLPSKEGGYSRTGSRTPMQWDSGKNAGFSSSSADKLYLPFGTGYKKLNVEYQQQNRQSLLNKVRQLTALRKKVPALQANGSFNLLYCEPNKYPLIYLRSLRKQKILVAINPSGKAAKTRFQLTDVRCVKNIITANGVELKNQNDTFTIEMKGVSYGIFELENM